MQSTTKRVPFANSKPNSALYSRARHRYRRDATRVCAGLFDRPLWDWKGHHHNVLGSLPNGSAASDLNNMTHGVEGYESEESATDLEGRVAKKSSKGVAAAESTKQTPSQKSKSSSAATSKGKSRASLPITSKNDSKSAHKDKSQGGRVSTSGRMSPGSDNHTPRHSSHGTGSKRPISALDDSLNTSLHHKKSRVGRKASSPVSTPPPHNSTSKHGKASSISSPSTTHSTALTPEPEDPNRTVDAGSEEDEEAIVEHRSSRPRYRKGWKGWALVDSEPDTSKLIEIDRTPQVFQGRSTRSGKAFGVHEAEEWEDGYVDFGEKSKVL